LARAAGKQFDTLSKNRQRIRTGDTSYDRTRIEMSAPAFDTLRRAQLRSVATAFLRIRPLVVGPVAPLVLVALWAGGAPHAQLVALAAVFASVLGFFGLEAWRSRRVEVGERWLRGSLKLTVVLL